MSFTRAELDQLCSMHDHELREKIVRLSNGGMGVSMSRSEDTYFNQQAQASPPGYKAERRYIDKEIARDPLANAIRLEADGRPARAPGSAGPPEPSPSFSSLLDKYHRLLEDVASLNGHATDIERRVCPAEPTNMGAIPCGEAAYPSSLVDHYDQLAREMRSALMRLSNTLQNIGASI